MKGFMVFAVEQDAQPLLANLDASSTQ